MGGKSRFIEVLNKKAQVKAGERYMEFKSRIVEPDLPFGVVAAMLRAYAADSKTPPEKLVRWFKDRLAEEFAEDAEE